MIVVADRQINCAACGQLVALVRQAGGAIPIAILLKDRYVVRTSEPEILYCNPNCKERAQV